MATMILHGRAGLQIVNRIKHEAPARCEDLTAAQHFLAHLLRRAEGQGLLRVHAPTPKDQPRAVFPL